MKDIEKNNEAFKALSLVSRRISELEAESERIKAENAKLRERVDYMTPIAWYAASEQERDRMRELGVEV